MRSLIIISLFFCLTQNVSAQYYSFNQHVKYADKCYEDGLYLLALKHYSAATELKDKLPWKSLYNYADAAYNVNSLKLSEQLFIQYQEKDKSDKQHEVLFKIINIRQKLQRYEEAILDCNIYLSEFEDVDPDLTNSVKKIKSSCQWVLAEGRNSLVDSVRPYPSVNSPYSEQAPVLFGDSLYFNSIDKPHYRDKQRTYISRIYKEGRSELEMDVDDDSGKFISHPSFSPDGKYFLYTLAEYGEDRKIVSDIYFRIINQEGELGISRKMPAAINMPDYADTHPMLVGVDTSFHLYFSSNRPGGKGGFDLWQATLSSDMQLVALKNLEELNTDDDEYSPFLNYNTNQLYFSSNGWPGYGGLDVFRVSINEDTIPENLGPKLNTSLDELFFSMNENGSEVYFSSNRPGSQFLDEGFQSCCFDIYTAEVTECSINLLALIYDRTSEEMLNNAELRVIDPETGAVVYSSSSEDNIFEVDLECDKEYLIESQKEGYDLYQLDFLPSNFSYGRENEIIRKIYLNPSIYDLDLTVLSSDTGLPLDSLDFVLENIATGEKTEIEKHPSNNIHFDLVPGTNYQIKVSRRGYRDTIELFNSGNTIREISKTIYLTEKEIIRQAKVSLANAIPVALYFDHDAPGQGDSTHLAAGNYTESYKKYFDKRGRYIYNYVSKFSGRKKDEARRQASQFFDAEVKAGFEKYDVFKNQLLLVLESGQNVNIYLRGYASPIALDDYNKALGRRRVDSVRKEFDDWNDGALLPYIKSGQLTVTERSFGEDTSPLEVSDDPKRPYASIYSPAASRERRVEIDEINFNEN